MRSKRLIGLICSLLVFMFVWQSGVLNAVEKDKNPVDSDTRGKVIMQWEEFRKLLELDKDEITLSWDEFQKLLSQTGKETPPNFQIKEGKVILSREQFKRMLDEMKPPVDPGVSPPQEYLITKGVYKGVMGREDVSFKAVFNLNIFERTQKQYLKIPLFQQDVALEEVLLDEKPALILVEGGKYYVTTDKTGYHTITCTFSVKASLAQGPHKFYFFIPQTSITKLDLNIPLKDIDVSIANAKQMVLSKMDSTTHISSILAPTNSMQVEWHKDIPEAAKGPSKIYADTYYLISLEDDALRTSAEIKLSILQNTISSVTLIVPEGYNILDVKGSDLGDWREYQKKERRYLEIPFEYARKGEFNITVTTERILPGESMVVDFAGFQVVDAIRDKGFIGIELKSTSEAKISEAKEMDRIDVQELPTGLLNRSVKPLIFGFKFLRPNYQLVLDVQKHKVLPVVSTVIDSASGVTLCTEDGKLVHRVVYKVRNSWKQFMELSLPEGAQLWSVFVDNSPVKPSSNEKNRVLIPLNRSSQGTTGLASFDVEIIYYEKVKRLGAFGHKKTDFPVPDIIISQVLWSVYLPWDYTYFSFGGTVEKEKIAQGFSPLMGEKRFFEYQGGYQEGKVAPKPEIASKKLRSEWRRNVNIDEAVMDQQMSNEQSFANRLDQIQNDISAVSKVAGTLPIRIQIPTSGQLYRFAKNIVNEEPLYLNFSYVNDWILNFIKTLILAVLAWFLYRQRDKVKKAYNLGTGILGVLAQKLKSSVLARHISLLLFIGAIPVWSLSRPLSIIMIILSIVRFWRDRRRKKKDKEIQSHQIDNL